MFFRHFTDKREVLFAGQDELRAVVVGALNAAPAELSALDAAVTAVEASAGLSRAVPTTPGPSGGHRLRLSGAARAGAHQVEGLVAAIAAGLARRDVPASAASLAAFSAVAVFRRGFECWIGAQEGPDLGVCIREALTELKAREGRGAARP